MRVSRQLCSSRLLVALAAWGGVSLLTASSAHATCGDYLAPAGGMDAHMSARHPMPEHTPGQTPSAPCRGPHCRSDNRTPVPPVPALKIVVPQWAVHLIQHTQLRRPVGPLPDEADLCRSQYQSDPPLRPPRAA
jgi:hypothetical protein